MSFKRRHLYLHDCRTLSVITEAPNQAKRRHDLLLLLLPFSWLLSIKAGDSPGGSGSPQPWPSVPSSQGHQSPVASRQSLLPLRPQETPYFMAVDRGLFCLLIGPRTAFENIICGPQRLTWAIKIVNKHRRTSPRADGVSASPESGKREKHFFGQSLNFSGSLKQPKMKKINNFVVYMLNEKLSSVQRNELPEIILDFY